MCVQVGNFNFNKSSVFVQLFSGILLEVGGFNARKIKSVKQWNSEVDLSVLLLLDCESAASFKMTEIPVI